MSDDERADAIVLANKLLEQPWADPDDDLRMLSRQLLRREERISRYESALTLLTHGKYPTEVVGIAREALGAK